MLSQIKQLIKEVEQDDEFFELIASVCKKATNALVDKGFTREDAIKIISTSLNRK